MGGGGGFMGYRDVEKEELKIVGCGKRGAPNSGMRVNGSEKVGCGKLLPP